MKKSNRKNMERFNSTETIRQTKFNGEFILSPFFSTSTRRKKVDIHKNSEEKLTKDRHNL